MDELKTQACGSEIEPAEFAVHVQQTKVEHEVSTLPLPKPHLKDNLKREK